MPAGFDLTPALPEVTLLVAACVVLVVDLFVPDSQRRISYWLTQLGLLTTAWFSLYVFHETPIRAFGNAFVADALADLLKFFSCITVVLTLLYSRE